MANGMRFIATISDKIKDLPVASGQLIFSTDDRIVYLDTDVRTSFQQIITIAKEDTRKELPYPVNGFYFITETKNLWQYESGEWTQITEPPKESMVFTDSKYSFPTVGEEKVLYIDKNNIYQWSSTEQEYIRLGEEYVSWQPME